MEPEPPVVDSPIPSPLRVLLWSPIGSSENYHGPGSFAYRLYSSDPTVGLKVTLAHGDPYQPPTSVYAQQHFVAHYGSGSLAMARFLWQSQRWLKHHLNDFDVFHGLAAYHYTMGPAYYAHRAGLPTVIFVAMHRDEFADKSGLKSLFGLPRRRREMLRQVDGVIAMSRAIDQELREYNVPPRKIARIPMGVNTSRFVPCGSPNEKTSLRVQLGLADRPTLLFVGALIERKRPDLLLEVLAKVLQTGEDCQLVMVGPVKDRVYANRMKDRAAQLNVTERTVWIDYTPEVERYYAAADLMALPSSEEGMPAAVVEAMSAGLVCVGTPVSGINDLIQNGVTGQLVPPDAERIAEVTCQYLRHRDLLVKHGAAARAKVLQSYSCPAVLRAYCDLFRRVVAGQDPCDASTLPEFGARP